jgi:hypothetical protein
MSPVLRSLAGAALLALFSMVQAPSPDAKDGVVVTALRNSVVKSYRRMVDGMDLFEKRRHLAPGASLRFKLLPRHRETEMRDIELQLVGNSFEQPIELATDNTFTLPREPLALEENATVRPDRKAGTLTWRAEVRTPGLPPGVRRLGDLRLECEVGMEAGLISNQRPSILGILLDEGPEYCDRPEPRYLFFAERPIARVSLIHGRRGASLSGDLLHAGASRNPKWREDLRYCDCEVLVERTFFVPLGDRSWPDDTLVAIEYQDAPAASGP